MRELVLIHGRAQEHKDSIALKKEWIDSLEEGLRKNNLQLPIPETAIHFPYYGQSLFDLSQGLAPDEAAEIIVRGDAAQGPEEQFLREVMAEVLGKALKLAVESGDLSAADLSGLVGSDVIERGFLNWGWVQKSLEWIDENVPGASGASIALATKDVHDYLNNDVLSDIIESGVRKALPPGAEAVVVSHSLGSIVAYKLVRREGVAQRWKVPLFLTVGSPLGIKAIRRSLAPLSFPGVVDEWFNALDPDDVVALYPLEDPYFAVDPIENYDGVENETSNQHGITGYLSDPVVALKIHTALVAGP